jgi:hypothetical protein
MADRSVLVRIRGDANDLIRATRAAGAAISGLRREIDTTNDRTAWMAQGFLALGPALAPLGAAAVPVLAGLAAQMTVAGVAGGSLVLAFKGIGDTMKAVNEYQLEPTAANFNKMNEALERFGPAGADFVKFLDSVGPKFGELQMAAREGMFPGMEQGIREVMDILPQGERIITNVSEAIGQLAADAGEGLAGEGFEEFFDYLETDAAPILVDMGHTFGNFATGLADMLVAFGPLTEDFSNGFRSMSEDFAAWADGLNESDSFTEFIDYVEMAVPMVLDTFGALADAFIQIIEAAAPVGEVMLPALEALFDVIAMIADTPLGTAFIAAAAGMSAYGRAVALANVTTGGLGRALFGVEKGFTATLRGADGAVAKMGAIRQASTLAAGGIGMVALSMTDIDEKAGVSNTAMGALLGTMIAPGWGTAIGTIAGGAIDINAAMNDATESTERLWDAIDSDDTAAITRGIERVREDLRALQEDQAAFMDLGPAEGQSYWDKVTSDFNAVIGDAHDMEGAINSARTSLKLTDFGAMIAPGLGVTADAFHRAALSAEDFRKSVDKAFALLDKRAALRATREALRDFADVMDEAPDKMREGGPAYDKVEEALDNIASSALTAAEHLRGMDRVNYLDKMRGNFIDAARQMGLTAQQARKLADNLGLLDKKKVKPVVDVDTRLAKGKIDEANDWLAHYRGQKPKARLDADDQPAKTKINSTERLLAILAGRKVNPRVDVQSNADAVAADTAAALNRIPDEEVWITTRRRGTGLGAVGGADGMTVPGERYPYGDKVLAYLAPGEEVISNRYGQADRHRELLQAINSNAYADGGTVRHVASSGGTRVLERIVEKLPDTITLDAGELGVVVIDTVNSRIDDYRAHDSNQAATYWQGVTSD